MFKTELGLKLVLDSWSPRQLEEETEEAMTSLNPMDNVKGKKIHLRDNLLHEVGS